MFSVSCVACVLLLVCSCGVRFVSFPCVSHCVGLCAMWAQGQVSDNHHVGVCAAVSLTFCTCKQVVRVGFVSVGGAREPGHAGSYYDVDNA